MTCNESFLELMRPCSSSGSIKITSRTLDLRHTSSSQTLSGLSFIYLDMFFFPWIFWMTTEWLVDKFSPMHILINFKGLHSNVHDWGFVGPHVELIWAGVSIWLWLEWQQEGNTFYPTHHYNFFSSNQCQAHHNHHCSSTCKMTFTFHRKTCNCYYEMMFKITER